MRRLKRWLLLIGLFVAGCESADQSPLPPQLNSLTTADEPEDFIAADTGSIRGRVIWQGDRPRVPTFKLFSFVNHGHTYRFRGENANPHAPKIDAETRGVGGAVVFLHAAPGPGVRPWDHAPVRVEMRRQGIIVLQGDEPRMVGLVQRGAEIEFINREVVYNTVRARGSAFFTLPLVVTDKASCRRLDQAGVVELSNSAGPYWQRAYLFVLDHPYVAITSGSGQFTIDEAPAGAYRLAVWLPNWHVDSEEHDSETAAIRRLTYAPAVELERAVIVAAGQPVDVDFELTEKLFAPSKKK